MIRMTQDEVWAVRDVIYAWLCETHSYDNWAWGDMADEASERYRYNGLRGVAEYFGKWLEYNPLTVVDLCARLSAGGHNGLEHTIP